MSQFKPFTKRDIAKDLRRAHVAARAGQKQAAKDAHGLQPSTSEPKEEAQMNASSSYDRVYTLLLTMEPEKRMSVWMNTSYANWLESKDNKGRETWMVTIFERFLDHLLIVARNHQITVQRINHKDGKETYETLVGESGPGWEPT